MRTEQPDQPPETKIVQRSDSYYDSITVSDVNMNKDNDESTDTISRTELDSHANMPCVGRNANIISRTGEFVPVNPFSPEIDAVNLEIVHAAVKYECPYTGKPYFLVIRNALHVKSMEHNLIPPFIMREAGVEVNDTPKIQCDGPSATDHSIYFKETDFRIMMQLRGIFSYFPTSRPTEEEMMASDDVYLLTPTTFNPHCDSFARNEENITDWQGNIIDKRHRQQYIISEIEENTAMTASMQVSSAEYKAIDNIFEDEDDQDGPVHPEWLPIPSKANQISSVLTSVSPLLDDMNLLARLEKSVEISKFKASIGSCYASEEKYLQHDDAIEVETVDSDDEDEEMEDQDDLVNDICDGVTAGNIDIDEIMVSAVHAGISKNVDPEHLAKVWRIDVEAAKRTLDITSQRSKRTDNPKLARNYGTNDRMLRYKRIDEYFFMDTFFATKKAGKSSRKNTCCQLFVTDKGFVYVVPMKSKGEVLQAVKQFAKEIGVPEAIICDMSGEQTSGPMKKFCQEIGTTLRILEEGTPWANKAELYIGLIKEAVRKDMKDSNCPLAFWDYCVERRARINNLTAKSLFKLHGTNAHTALTGEEGDISNLCQFGWYEWCYYRDNTKAFPLNRETLGRVLGPALGAGNEMSQWILNGHGNVLPRRSARPLTVAERHSKIEAGKQKIFDALIERRHGTAIKPPIVTTKPEEFEEYQDEYEKAKVIPENEDIVDSTGKLLNQMPAYDKILHAEVSLQLGEEMAVGKVTRRALGPDGRVTGTYDDNPMMNSMVYEIEFADGQIKEYAANIIAENMLTQVDADGYTTIMMKGIIDFRKDYAIAVPKSDKYVITRRGRKKLRTTTIGWSLLVQWSDGSETWVPLKDMKASHPCEVAEFAKARGIDDEAAFAWWVPFTLRKRDVIISKLKARIRKTTHKYGVEIPKNIKHAYDLDAKNGNNMWRDALNLEMTEVGVAFEVLEEGQQPPVGWRKVTGHLVWDCKMDFTRKSRWVLDGHKTPDPVGSTYAGVVSRESVRIAFTYAALNGLEVYAADIRNAYLQAPSSQKDYIICGPEFGIENIGKVALIHRALYGGKSAGKDFRDHLRGCMRHLNFVSCPADPDVWMRPAKRSDGSDYYEYILLYTDDALVLSENAESVLRNELGKYFALKEKSIGPPRIYLGGGVRKVQLENGIECWAFSSSQYVQAAVKNVEEYLNKHPKSELEVPEER